MQRFLERSRRVALLCSDTEACRKSGKCLIRRVSEVWTPAGSRSVQRPLPRRSSQLRRPRPDGAGVHPTLYSGGWSRGALVHIPREEKNGHRDREAKLKTYSLFISCLSILLLPVRNKLTSEKFRTEPLVRRALTSSVCVAPYWHSKLISLGGDDARVTCGTLRSCVCSGRRKPGVEVILLVSSLSHQLLQRIHDVSFVLLRLAIRSATHITDRGQGDSLNIVRERSWFFVGLRGYAALFMVLLAQVRRVDSPLQTF